MDKSIYFRVDANKEIATGHLMRCLSIADAAADIGVSPVFIMADNCGCAVVESRGYKCIVLDTAWDDMESELPVLCELIRSQDIKLLLIDSYSVTPKYLDEVTKKAYTIFISDLDAFDYSVNSIICYANYYEKFNYKERYPDKKLLLGCEYVPLRREFIGCPEKEIKENIRRLLILSGGSDNHHIVNSILDCIDIESYECIDAVCGRYSEDFDLLNGKYALNSIVRIHKSIDNIGDYMKDADVVISAGGTTLYELCACGAPTVSYSFADNQIDNVKKFDEDGIIKYAGDVRNCDIAENIRKLLCEYDDYEYRKSQSFRMQQVVDGKGAKRIAGEILRKLTACNTS